MILADKERIFSIERPHSNLWTHYIIRSLKIPPFTLALLPFLYFRYYTLRYRFDEEGISMSWGILFRREVNLTYTRIQDIHLTSGLIQRWLGLADIHIQTASGTAAAEITLEGLLEYQDIRDFLYSRMRGYQSPSAQVVAEGEKAADSPDGGAAREEDLVAAIRDVHQELRAARIALEKLAGHPGERGV